MEALKLPYNLKKLPEQVAVNENLWSSRTSTYKNHHRASKYGFEIQRKLNPDREMMYNMVLKRVKELYKSLPNRDDRFCIEIDFKKHPTNSSMLHTFQTVHFYFALECNLQKDYQVEFYFYKCPFITEIHGLMKKLLIFPIAKEITKPDYQAFFNRCLQVQPDRFIHVL